MKIAYADPPYPEQSAKHYGDHPDFDGEVDWQKLCDGLDSDFDGWALSTGSKWLHETLNYFARPDELRVLCWVKPMSPPFPNIITYAWEPVILRAGRQPQSPVPRDYLICSPEGHTFRAQPEGHVIGAKPPGFCRWLFDCLGADPTDEFTDLFPGSGGVGREWENWCAQPKLPHPELPRNTRRAREKAGIPFDGLSEPVPAPLHSQSLQPDDTG